MSSVTQQVANLSSNSDVRALQSLLSDLQRDVAELHASLVALTVKLDQDATVTDTDYAATCSPDELKTTP